MKFSHSRGPSVKLHWLFPSLLGLWLWSAPVQAASLQYWRFDARNNRLEFATNGQVQPTAQLIFNPTRLVIDLPGTTLGNQIRSQLVSTPGIKQVRTGQFERNTTRIVIELNSGYTLDPSQVRFIGSSASQWTVQLPEPQREGTTPSNPPAARPVPQQPSPNPTGNRTGRETDPSQPSLIQAIELSGNNSQLVIRASGPVNAVGQWPNPSVYTLSISPARLGQNPPQIPTSGNSPFSRFNVQQADGETVVISMTPRSGFTLGQINQAGSQVIALSLGSSGSPVPPIATAPNPPSANIPIPVPRPANPQPTPTFPPPTQWPLPAPGRTPNSGIRVAIDPGHGGRDPGAVGIGGLRETDVVLDISRQVAAILQQNGVQAVLTRDREVEIDLAPRVNFAEQVNATLFVSIHANAISMSRPDINGVETYYYNSGARLAQAIQGSILRSIPMTDRGVKSARFYVLRRTSMPSVLVETGFVTGAEDAPRLATPAFRSQMAQAIANGILLYIRQNY